MCPRAEKHIEGMLEVSMSMQEKTDNIVLGPQCIELIASTDECKTTSTIL